jgi:DNA-directed RNA polymerase subunit RPC12/RpoP
LAASVSEGNVRVWSTAALEPIAKLPFGFVRPLAFSPDGALLGVASSKAPGKEGPGRGDVRFYDTKTWTPRLSIKAHEHGIFTVAFSPDGQTLASASHDGTIRFHAVPSTTGSVRPPTPVKVAPNPLVGDVDKSGGDAPQAATGRSFAWVMWALVGAIFVLTVALVGLVGLIWLRRRQSGAPEKVKKVVSKKKPEPQMAPTLVEFRCACGKRLKARTDAAGKKVKCPDCGDVLVVPSVQASTP